MHFSRLSSNSQRSKAEGEKGAFCSLSPLAGSSHLRTLFQQLSRQLGRQDCRREIDMARCGALVQVGDDGVYCSRLFTWREAGQKEAGQTLSG